MGTVRNLAETLRDQLDTHAQNTISMESIHALEKTIFDVLEKLPEDADSIQKFLTCLDAKRHGANIFSNLIKKNDIHNIDNIPTKAELIDAAKKVIDIAKYNQRRLELLTVADPDNPNSEKGYFEKIYFHGSIKKNDAKITDKINEINALKTKVSSKKCSLDNLQEYNKLASDGFNELNRSFPSHHIIDPLQPNNEKLLTALLKQQEEKVRNRGFFGNLFAGLLSSNMLVAGKTYIVHNTDPAGRKIKSKIRLTNDILIQHEAIYNPLINENDLSPRFRIISDQKPLGKGKQGITYAAVGTIKFRANDKLDITMKETKIIKQITGLGNSYSRIKKEADFLRKVIPKAKRALNNSKTPFTNQNYIVDERFSGSMLKSVIENQQKKHDDKSYEAKDTNWLTDVSSNLLYALQHIHAHGIIHHDVHSDNIMVNKSTKEARIIDLGSAKNATDLLQFGGNRKFRPPEKNQFSLRTFGKRGISISFSFRGLVGKRSDVYMLGKALAELWATNPNVRKEAESNPTLKALTDQLNTLLKIDWGKKSKLKKAHKKLEELVHKTLANTSTLTPTTIMVARIASLLNSDRKDRADLDTTIKNFEKVRLDKKSGDVKDTFKLAHETHLALLNIEAKTFSVKKLKETLVDAINKIINDTPEIINEFQRTLKIKAFNDIRNKADLSTAVNAITDDFTKNFNALLKLQKDVVDSIKLAHTLPPRERKTAENQLMPLLHEINHKVQKARTYPVTLDHLDKFNKKLARDKTVEEFSARLKDFDDHANAKVSQQVELLRALKVTPVPALAADADKARMKNAVSNAIRRYLTNNPHESRLPQIRKILNVMANDGDMDARQLKAAIRSALGTQSFFKSSQLRDGINFALSASKPRNKR